MGHRVPWKLRALVALAACAIPACVVAAPPDDAAGQRATDAEKGAVEKRDASGPGRDRIAQQLKAVEFCYGVSALAASTVSLRNSGQTLDEVLARRKSMLGEDEYVLIADISRQVFENDLRDPLAVAADTNVACLQLRGFGKSFAQAAQRYCPRVGMMRAEVDAMRRGGASADATVAALVERYGETRTALSETLEQVARAEPRGDKPDNGTLDHQMCMTLAITGY